MENITQRDKIAKFYDGFSKYQKRTGANLRVQTIFKNLDKILTNSKFNVLEIGCGVGILTNFISKKVKNGKVIATDISPQGIEEAKILNLSNKNASFFVTDMSDFKSPIIFDVVVLADVLEHIPIQDHDRLFNTILSHSHEKTIVAINIPSPYYIEWISKFTPNELQVIDQSLYTNVFLNSIYKNDFYLFNLTTYSLSFINGDYQWMLFKRTENIDNFKKISKNKQRIYAIKLMLIRFFYSLN